MAGNHDGWLIVLSVVVAIVASYVALDLSARIAAARRRRGWLSVGAVAMGSGIWAMHYVGMLAHPLPVRMGYDLWLTLLSLALAIAGAGFAFYLVLGAWRLSRLLVGGGLMGAGIAAMHYTGMASITVEPPIRHQPAWVALSLLIAVAASMIAMWCAFSLRMETPVSAFWKKAGSALLMGSAISGLHYTAMAGAIFAPGSVSTAEPYWISEVSMAGIVGAVSLVFQWLVLVLASFDAYRAEHSGRAANTLATLNARLAAQGDELKAANHELDSFAARIAHDLGGPLGAMRGFAQAVKERAGERLDAVSLDYLDRIIAAAERGERMTASLLAFARLGDAPLRRGDVDLNDVLRRARSSVEPHGGGRAIEWDIAPLPTVRGDASLLEQVFVNLLANALKYTRPCEQARIEVGHRHEPGHGHTVWVRDNGVGFDPAYADKLFSPFHRLHGADRFEGHGMGLANVRRIVLRHAGSVSAQGTPGEGATFSIELPE
ncbi:MAG TPA: MHYT domain-containing protein [Albitalea sp.]|jgi:NO-binding membrane sensor protein with MHYT domain|nr:MHYT domain-containing protein [Albitalea sp.]